MSDPVKRGLALGLFGTWTHLAVHSFVDKLYVNNLFLHIGVMVGLLAAARYHIGESSMNPSNIMTKRVSRVCLSV